MEALNTLAFGLLAQIPSSNLDSLPKVNLSAGPGGSLQTILSVMFAVAGGIALIMLTYGSLRFVLSRGNPDEVSKARNTMIDALIGLAIVITSFGIISFVVYRASV